MKRRIPAQRIDQFKSIAGSTRRTGVIVAVRDEVVAGQYCTGVKSAGGDLANLYLHILGGATCDALPQTIEAYRIEPKDKP